MSKWHVQMISKWYQMNTHNFDVKMPYPSDIKVILKKKLWRKSCKFGVILMSRWLAKAISKWYYNNNCNFNIILMLKWHAPNLFCSFLFRWWYCRHSNSNFGNIVCPISILWLTPMGKDSVHISGQIVNTQLCSWELKEISCDDILNASCQIRMRWDQEWPVEGKCWVHKYRAGAADSALIDPLVYSSVPACKVNTSKRTDKWLKLVSYVATVNSLSTLVH